MALKVTSGILSRAVSKELADVSEVLNVIRAMTASFRLRK
jgi:hypothetical protein